MTCSRCRGPVEWDVTPGLPIPPEPHTVCVWCGAVDSQRERLANMSGARSEIKDEDHRTMSHRRAGDYSVGIGGRPKRKPRPKQKQRPKRVPYSIMERAILSQRMKANAELVAELAAAGFQRTEVAVAVWRSAHGMSRIKRRGRS